MIPSSHSSRHSHTSSEASSELNNSREATPAGASPEAPQTDRPSGSGSSYEPKSGEGESDGTSDREYPPSGIRSTGHPGERQELGGDHDVTSLWPGHAGSGDWSDSPLEESEGSVVGDYTDSYLELISPSGGDGAGQPPRANGDLYNTASGMGLVVVDCFEEMFTPGFTIKDSNKEIQEAIQSGMDPERACIEAARAHRALSTCMRLPTGLVLYERLFSRLTSALHKARKIRGTAEEQKSVFLMEATAKFEVEIEGCLTEYYFDDLHLEPSLFHADLLVTKLVQVGRPTHPRPTGRRASTYSLAEAHCSRAMAQRAQGREQWDRRTAHRPSAVDTPCRALGPRAWGQ